MFIFNILKALFSKYSIVVTGHMVRVHDRGASGGGVGDKRGVGDFFRDGRHLARSLSVPRLRAT